MEASLGVPTATSVRTVPAKLLEVNRQILNNHLARSGRGGKVSFTHLIAFASLQRARPGAGDERELRRGGRQARRRAPRAREPRARGRPRAQATARARCSSPTSRAPTRSTSPRSTPPTKTSSASVRAGKLVARRLRRHHRHDHQPGDDRHDALGAAAHAGPGLHPRRRRDRLPRRVRGRRRAHDRPARASARRSRSRARTTTASSRVRRAVEFLAVMHDLLLGERRLLRRHLPELRRPVRAGALERRRERRARRPTAAIEKAVHVQQLINMYRVRGHLIANLDPLGRARPQDAPRARHQPLRPHDLGPRP